MAQKCNGIHLLVSLVLNYGQSYLTYETLPYNKKVLLPSAELVPDFRLLRRTLSGGY